MSIATSRTLSGKARVITFTAAAAAVLTTLSACSSSDAATGAGSAAKGSTGSAGSTAVIVGAHSNGAATQTTISVATQADIRAKLPKSVLDSGKLTVGIGALPGGFPPLAYLGDDEKSLTGAEPDLGRLVAAVLGLTPEVQNSTWDNLFVGIDSSSTDVGFSNITDTETRKLKYDFASYRQDNLGFEVLATSKWEFAGNYENLADQTVAVSSGTNQEKILLEWQTKLKAEGKTLNIKYFPDQNGVVLALASGQISAYFGPNPGIAYRVKGNAKSANPTRTAGTYSGAGATLQGLIAATTKKDSGLVQPVADAINYLIEDGDYAKWLSAYNLSNEAVSSSLINPPGLPKTNT